jgi:hypothetical protein
MTISRQRAPAIGDGPWRYIVHYSDGQESDVDDEEGRCSTHTYTFGELEAAIEFVSSMVKQEWRDE